MAKTIIVCCPGDVVTGGPELLHQLVHEIRAMGKKAFINYYPFNKSFSTPNDYLHYDAPQKQIIDSQEALIIFPETATHLIPAFNHSRVGIWWLSLNNYLGSIHDYKLKNVLEDMYWKIKGKKSLRQMKTYVHFAQSYYARNFLEMRGIHSEMLTDYLGRCHTHHEVEYSERLDQVAYNPKKGLKNTQKLIFSNPEISFIPIQDMSPKEVRDLLKRTKVYIDFGTHPGKDRFPREAAMAGCCVITGRQGSAENPIDIPIPSKYKLDESSNIFVEKFRFLIDEIFSNFDSCSGEFNKYRSLIRGEPQVFREQVKNLFIDPTSSTHQGKPA